MNLPFMWYKSLGGTFVRFVTIHACDGQTDRRTDRQTDGQTDTFAVRKTACILLRGKNAQICNLFGGLRFARRMMCQNINTVCSENDHGDVEDKFSRQVDSQRQRAHR